VADETPPNEPTPEVVPDPVFLVDDGTKQFFDQYVGPGKKYPNVGELAKAYFNADTHIAELSRDAGKFRTEAESLKELLMQNLVNANPNEPNPNDEPNPNNPNEETPPAKPLEEAPPKVEEEVDIRARVKEALEEVTKEERQRKNAELTEAATIKHFGSQEDAVKAVAAKADELGVNPQWLANLAFDSPKAYFVAMGFDPEVPPRSSSTPAPRSDVRADQLPNTGVKPNTYAWYNELRRTDPGKYRSAEVQTALMRDAQTNPDFFPKT
jgi:hypothetical protein